MPFIYWIMPFIYIIHDHDSDHAILLLKAFQWLFITFGISLYQASRSADDLASENPAKLINKLAPLSSPCCSPFCSSLSHSCVTGFCHWPFLSPGTLFQEHISDHPITLSHAPLSRFPSHHLSFLNYIVYLYICYQFPCQVFLVAYGMDWQGQNTHAEWSQVKLFQIPPSPPSLF